MCIFYFGNNTFKINEKQYKKILLESDKFFEMVIKLISGQRPTKPNIGQQ